MGKTSISNLKLISTDNFLKFLIEKNSLKSNLKLQLAYVNGSKINTSDNEIHNFSITKLGKRKKKTVEPIDSIIIRPQKNVDIEGGLNPIEIEIKDDKISNIFKKYKNSTYKIIPLGLLFPATITNESDIYFEKKLKWSQKVDFKSKNI